MKPWMTTNSRVIRSCVSKTLIYNVVNTQAPSCLIANSSFLQVARTTITSRTSLKFDQIRSCLGENDGQMTMESHGLPWYSMVIQP